MEKKLYDLTVEPKFERLCPPLREAERALLRAKSKAGKVVFLNPIPEKKWPYLKGCQSMSMLTTMLSCSTLGELARACRKLLGS